MTDELKPLSKKHQVFVNEYLKCFNGTEAYCKVYPKSSRESARANASELLAKDNIKAEIADRLSALQMSADEALQLTAEIARADFGDFLNDFGGVDVSQARLDGKTRLIRKWSTKTVTINGKNEDKEIHTEDIELYDRQAALRDILKIHGKYSDAPTVNINMSWKDFVSANRETGDKQSE